MQVITDEEDGNDNGVLDLSVKKCSSIMLSPPASSPSSSSSSLSLAISPKSVLPANKRVLDINLPLPTIPRVQQTNKRPLRFQCKHCDYRAPSTSLMQNHIYRHTDLTPYACAYCGHKSTTKSTIMVHIELCHPNMEVKILENRVREQDFYVDLNNIDASFLASTTDEPQTKRQRHIDSYNSESTPINGVAVPLKSIMDDRNELSPTSDDTNETEHLSSSLLSTFETADGDQKQQIQYSPVEPSPLSLKLKLPVSSTPTVALPSKSKRKESDSEDDSEYLLVYNRPKQYYGSLYEPDKQYACRLCSYTTNHRPSMEDHVFVHTDEKPYKCGYCGEEIYTRYAATYHIKYKHAGMARNFIQNKADVTQYYVNRAKKEEEKNQFKVVDTRRVKVPARNGKSVNNQQNKDDMITVRQNQREESPIPSAVPESSRTPPQTSIPKSSRSQSSTPPQNNLLPPSLLQYPMLLAWSYYLAAQNPWALPMLHQQHEQLSASLPSDPEAANKLLQIMQTVMNSSSTRQLSTNKQSETEDESEKSDKLLIIKEEINE